MNYLFKHKNIGIAAVVALMAMFTGCDLAEVNENPNEPSSTQTPFLLTNAQKDLADNYWGEFELGYFGNLYSQYWSQNQYTAESRYNYRDGVVNSTWADYYTSLNDLQEIIRLNREFPEQYAAYGNNANQIAVAKILKAWTYQTLTDIWGSIPFEGEALQGRENPSPAYSSQEEVYRGIITMLTEASDSINVDAPGFTSGDVIYGEGPTNASNMEQWRRFANSLKMRAAIRIADRLPDLAATAISEALAAGVMQSNEDNALFVYLPNIPNANPISEAYLERDDFAVSVPLISTLQANNDPRISSYADTTESDEVDTYVGFPYGLAQGLAAAVPRDEFSRPSTLVRSATFPAIFMLYDEVLFIQAEAALRGFTSGDAAALYEQAIRASMEFWGVTDQAAIDAYIAANPLDQVNWRQSLGVQKWLAMYMQGIQGWAEWRRLDFEGVLVPPESGKLAVTFPTPIAIRYPYPSDEYNLNEENVTTAVQNQGWDEDDQGQFVWWDIGDTTP
ncbi:MAG TPA: SusD/RagB family nutrient-binding outer membrane lipoprotein [Balneolaceae bacterium]